MVRAKYQRKMYIGKICKYNSKQDDYFINSMERRRRLSVYFWPKCKDTVWVTVDIINEVSLSADGEVTDLS